MRKYRSHEAIIHSILCVTNGGALLSHVLSKAGINSYQWPELWYFLTEKDLLVEMDGCYSTTEKGLQWLNDYDMLWNRNPY